MDFNIIKLMLIPVIEIFMDSFAWAFAESFLRIKSSSLQLTYM